MSPADGRRQSSRTAIGELAEGSAAAVVPIPVDAAAPEETRSLVASQWQLMWWKFRRHRLAMVCGVVVILLLPRRALRRVHRALHPDRPGRDAAPTTRRPRIHFLDADGDFHLRPFVYGTTSARDLETLELVFDGGHESSATRSASSSKGESYKLFGFIPWDRHLFGSTTPSARIFLLGADRLGQDLFSRLVYGTRISMSIGLVGVAISFVLGIVARRHLRLLRRRASTPSSSA